MAKQDCEVKLFLTLLDKDDNVIFNQEEPIPRNFIVKQFKFLGYNIRIEKRND